MLKNELGCEYVLNSSDKDFDNKLEIVVDKLGANVALECVAGDMPGRLLDKMPTHAVCV